MFPRKRRESQAAENLPVNFFCTLCAKSEINEPSRQSTGVDLLHPDDFELVIPDSLSPSSINEFRKCPQSFLFQYLWKLRQPINNALATGTMCHAALEQVFDLEPPDRSIDNLQNLFRRHWAEHRKSVTYKELFENPDDKTWNQTAEIEWGSQSLGLLENYIGVEDPSMVSRPNPLKREVWVRANLTVRPEAGATGYTTKTIARQHGNNTFSVRGIIDRLDMVPAHDQVGERVVLRLIDYKSGKAPNLKYSAAMNQKIQSEAFFQLLIYALLYRETKTDSLPLRYLRLFYLTSHQDNTQAVTREMDLGATEADRDRVLQGVHATLSNVWLEINDLVNSQDPSAFAGCDRSFCFCHVCRSRFKPGTLWEPEASS